MSKIAICLSLGLHEERPRYTRSIRTAIKKEHPALQTLHFLNFFLFCGSFLSSAYHNQFESMQIRIQILGRINKERKKDPDPLDVCENKIYYVLDV